MCLILEVILVEEIPVVLLFPESSLNPDSIKVKIDHSLAKFPDTKKYLNCFIITICKYRKQFKELHV